MALLIVEHAGSVKAGVISGRVVIGRRPEHQIRAADKGVSPIHAWIGVVENGAHFIADAGSRTGTFVNDERVVVRQPLQTGDRIRIGPLSLTLAEGECVPAGTQPIDLRARPLPAPTPAGGISFDCACGAPMWAPWDAAGKIGRCRSCGAPISVPRPPPPAAPARKGNLPPRHPCAESAMAPSSRWRRQPGARLAGPCFILNVGPRTEAVPSTAARR